MTKELSKAIMFKSKVKKPICLNGLLGKNFLAYKKIKNKCNSMNKKCENKNTLKNATSGGIMNNKFLLEYSLIPFL